jgi:hypothetical protein
MKRIFFQKNKRGNIYTESLNGPPDEPSYIRPNKKRGSFACQLNGLIFYASDIKNIIKN